MTSLRFSLLCVVALAVACSKEATFTEPLPPMGAIHWVHAVADTGAMDFRPIDIVTNAGLFDAAFRGANQLPQGIEAGTRRIRVFMSSTDPAITGVPIVDTSFVVAKRLKHGRPIYSADRWHLHHRFVNIGFSQRRAALTMWAWCGTLGAAALATRFVPFREGGVWHPWETFAVATLALVALAFSAYIVYLLEIVKLANPRIRRREAERSRSDRLSA